MLGWPRDASECSGRPDEEAGSRVDGRQTLNSSSSLRETTPSARPRSFEGRSGRPVGRLPRSIVPNRPPFTRRMLEVWSHRPGTKHAASSQGDASLSDGWLRCLARGATKVE